MRTSSRLPRMAALTLPAALAAASLAVLPAAVAAPAAAAPLGAPAAAPLTAPVSLAAVPQGPLPATGCTRTGSAASCDLYAKPGTLVVSSTSIPIWGLAGDAAAPASTPGPVLVVTAGDAVTVTVHNGLSQPLGLAFPGISGLAGDTTGAAPGGSTSYRFTATRPGTYLYEAAHTADGARQAAMGIVGAMVVRPAAGQSAYGDTATAFDDEAVLVLSEIDPALNANPAGFDLRQFHPAYRLINGNSYPETAPIATGADRRVLLRYVNAGLVMHPMGVLGTTETVVGQGARPAEAPYPVVSDSIGPGETVDAVVTVPPAGDGSRFAVYETAGRLDTAGRLAGTGKTVAFGGMLTFLDTSAAPASGDTVGPVTQHLTVTPPSATALQSVTVRADLTDAPNGNSAVTGAEYVIDNPAVAVGSGTPLSGAFGTPAVTGATATVDLSAVTPALAAGRHTVYVRAVDAQGNWGPVNSVILTVSSSGPATLSGLLDPADTNGTRDVALSATGDDTLLGGTVDQAEYFVGTPGADGSGTPLALTPSGTAGIVAEAATIPAASLSAQPEGQVTVYLHSHDSFGLWGPMVALPLVLDQTPPTLVSGAANPARTNGTNGSPVDPTAIQVSGTFTDPVAGTVHSPIAAAEGFLDNPAGVAGTGLTFVANDGAFNASTETAYGLVPLSELTGLTDGTHTVYVHARDGAGNWGPLAAASFVVDRTGPVVTAASAAPATVSGSTATLTLNATATDPLSGVTAAEYYEGADPGKGAGTPMTVGGGNPAALTASIPAGGLTPGTHTYSIRARDGAGNWGAVRTVTVTVVAALFADGFESGNAGLWNGGTVGTGVAVSTAARLTGSYGMQVTGSGYVVDTTPSGPQAYHATFQLNAGTLTAGTGTVNVFTALNGTGGTVLAVQFRRNGGTAQVRLGVTRVGGTTYTGWLTVTGTQAISVDWARGATAAARLRVGATAANLAGLNTTAQVVESVRLGLSGATATVTGYARFDTFTSTR